MANGDNDQQDVIPPGDATTNRSVDDAVFHIDCGDFNNIYQVHSRNASIESDKDVPVSVIASSGDGKLVICVICLEPVDDPVTAIPCRHVDYHFSCLGTWLQQNTSCPLCKTLISSVRYRDPSTRLIQIFHLSHPDTSPTSRGQSCERHGSTGHRRHQRGVRRNLSPYTEDPSIDFRRSVYEQTLRSRYVGNNHISRYRNVTSTLIASDSYLTGRARKWIRRELRALDPYDQFRVASDSPLTIGESHMFQNNEFLLEYIIAILKNIDLRGNAGQAEILLGEHLGRQSASIFVHELEHWLRSPFDTLEEWDNYVQYFDI